MQVLFFCFVINIIKKTVPMNDIGNMNQLLLVCLCQRGLYYLK